MAQDGDDEGRKGSGRLPDRNTKEHIRNHETHVEKAHIPPVKDKLEPPQKPKPEKK
jgi:hypothetical protein